MRSSSKESVRSVDFVTLAHTAESNFIIQEDINMLITYRSLCPSPFPTLDDKNSPGWMSRQMDSLYETQLGVAMGWALRLVSAQFDSRARLFQFSIFPSSMPCLTCDYPLYCIAYGCDMRFLLLRNKTPASQEFLYSFCDRPN